MNTEFISKGVESVKKHKKKAVAGTGLVSIITALVLPLLQAHSVKVETRETNILYWQELQDTRVELRELRNQVYILLRNPKILSAVSLEDLQQLTIENKSNE